MLRLARLLDAVTLRRVVVFLLLAGFARQILIVLGWLASVGWGLWGVSTVRACLLATANLAFEATLIYLALRGLGSLLERRPGGPSPTSVESTLRDQEPPAYPEEIDGTESQAPGWPDEGGDDGRGPDHR